MTAKELFETAWNKGGHDLEDKSKAKLILGHDEGDRLRRDPDMVRVLKEVAREAFFMGFAATSGPACEHGINTTEDYCDPCAVAASEGQPAAATLKPKEEAPDPFQEAWEQDLHDHAIEVLNSESGIGIHAMRRVSKRAFEAGSFPAAYVQDLQAEHEALRLSVLQALIKVGVIDRGSMNAPWDAVTLLRFVGLWLADGMPWVKQGKDHRQLAGEIRGLKQHVSYQGTRLDELAGLMERVTTLEKRLRNAE